MSLPKPFPLFAKGAPGNFDFTLEFQDAAFSLVSSGMLLLLAPARYFVLQARKRQIEGNFLMRSKLGAIFIIGGLRLAALVVSSKKPLENENGPLAVAAATVALASVLAMGMLSPAEHAKSLRPSTVLTLYLLVSCCFDVVRTRTMWLGGHVTLAGISLASVIAQVFLFVMESWEKRSFALEERKTDSPETYAGFINRLFFWWINGMLRTGFRSVLALEDVYEVEESLNANGASARFRQAWQSELKKNATGKPRKHALAMTVLKLVWWRTFLGAIAHAINLLLNFSQPLLLNRTIYFLQHKESHNVGYGLIAAYGLVYIGMALSVLVAMTQNSKLTVEMRGMLVAEIYDKTLGMDLARSSDLSTATLMSTDVMRFAQMFSLPNLFWSSMAQVGLAVWLLEKQVGLICLVPIGTCLFVTSIGMIASGAAGPRQGAWMEAITSRINFTAEFLGLLKVAKLTGMSSKLTKHMRSLRAEEIEQGNRFRRLVCLITTLAFSPGFLAPGLTFLAFFGLAASQHRQIDVSTVFTSLSLVMLMSSPLISVIQLIPDIPAALACGMRIQSYLLSASRSDPRNVSSSAKAPGTGPSVASALATASDDIISLAGSSFGWVDAESETTTVLEDVNLRLARGGLHVVTGPVACGKSTLLKGILGEAVQLGGIVHVNEMESAFCDQNVWLQNGTVRENIVAFGTFDEALYRKVLKVTALDLDILSWPKGDQTPVGSNGLALSGGQKRRIALARALFSLQKLFILDDVFDGLDAATETRVAHNLFGSKGMLRESANITSVVATHSRTVMAMAETVTTLDATGSIVSHEVFGKREIAEYVDNAAMDTIPLSGSGNAEDGSKSGLGDVSLDGSATDRRSGGDWRMYAYYFSATGKMTALVFMLLIMVFGFFNTFPNVWLKIWTEVPQTSTTNNAKYVAVYFVLQVLSTMSIGVLILHFFNVMIPQAGARLHELLLTTAYHARLAYLTETDTGVILNMFSQDIEMLDGTFPEALLEMCATLTMVISQMVLIALSTWYVAVAYPVFLALVWGLQRMYLRTSRQMRHLDLEAKSPIYTVFLETSAGLATVRAFGWAKESKDNLMKLLNASQKPWYMLMMLQQWLSLVLDLMVAALALIVIGVSVAMRDSVSIGFTAVSLVSLISFGENIKVFVSVWVRTETSMGALLRIKSFSEDCKPENEGDKAPVDPGPSWPSAGEIAIRQYSAAYKDSAPNALEDISVSLPAGTKVAVCGRTGSGKSTLITSLLRFVRVTGGSIEVDGVNLEHVDRETVRHRFVVVSQDACIVKLPLRFNMDPHGEHSDQEIENALERVGLAEKIKRLGGLDFEPSAESFSHGQKQLLGLARAILKPGKVVILDEATSGVDSETEKTMQAVIDQEFRGRTILAVTHHLRTIQDYSVVILMKSGVVEDIGKPSELLARNAGFKEMYDRSMDAH